MDPNAGPGVSSTSKAQPTRSPRPETRRIPAIDILVATYQSEGTLGPALRSARAVLPNARILVVDRHSTDGTVQIATQFGAEVFEEDRGLGRARNLALERATSEAVLFLDSDVEIVRPDFILRAWEEYCRPRTAAVVGATVGHPFHYGLPLGLTLLGRAWALTAAIPDDVQSRETYYLQRAARRAHLQVRFVPDAMRHAGTFRSAPHWPEFQGAAVRRSSGWNPRELVYSAMVVMLMHMNSHRPRNVLYSPIFYGKLLRGFLAPDRWSRLDRTRVSRRSVARPPPEG
jgi:glycosyltransferase involved in cell wall biosynthesis